MERNYIRSIRPFLKELSPLEPLATAAKPKIKKGHYKAVIFDIYGTLLISSSGDVDMAEYNGTMVKKALEAANFEIIKDTESTYDYIYNTFNACINKHLDVGRKEGKVYPEVNILKVTEDTLKIAETEGLIKSSDKSDSVLFCFVFELQSNKVWPMPGMQEVIKKLRDSNLTLGIISNAQFYTPVIMNHLLHNIEKDSEIIEPFLKDLTVYSFKELRGKPDIALFERLLPNLTKRGIKPEETLFVGNDMLKDIYTAHKAGLKTVLFAGDKRSYRPRKDDEHCANLKPDYVITELKQLLEIIEG